MKRYTVYEGDAPSLAHPTIIRKLLARRGFTSPEGVDEFLSPDYEKHTHNPFLMKGMKKAVERILKAIDLKEKIIVYGDYDADGIPGAVVLNDFFKRIKYPITIYIPHRSDEGYGFHSDAVAEFVKDKVSLLITVDCGTSDFEAVEKAQQSGIDVIITDHHLPQETLPSAYAILNPKQEDCKYPEKMLCGAGVAFKLVQALLSARDFALPKGIEKWSLDMVALATLSDSVPLVGENRVFAKYGLFVLQKSPRKGLKALFKKIKLFQAHVSEDDIVFMVTPRINAASRMGNPYDAFSLLSTDSDEEANNLAELLHTMNDKRKGAAASIVREIHGRLNGDERGKKVIVMGNPSWKPSLLGLVAMRISEDTEKTVFLWGRDDSVIRGSCRSDGYTDVVALMTSIKNSFVRFGGHRFAGGFTLSHDEVHTLEENLLQAHQNLSQLPEDKSEYIADARLSLDDVNWGIHRLIEPLSPFGLENPKPVFLFENISVEKIKHFGKNGQLHLSLEFLNSRKSRVSAIGFFMKKDDFPFPIEEKGNIDLVASLEKSMFRGFPELRLRIINVLPSVAVS